MNLMRMLLTILFMLFCHITSAQDIEIKSLKAYAGSDQTKIPLIVSSDNEFSFMTIEFDAASEFEPNLNIVFRFCDKNWNPTDNIFLANTGRNTAFNLDLSLLPTPIEGASYHYKNTFPNEDEYVNFPFSGKWRFYITESYDTSIVYAEGKFIVVNDSMDITASLKRETIEGPYVPIDLSKVFNISVNFNLPDGFFPSNVQHVEIFENHKLDYPYILKKNENGNNRAFYWDGGNSFKFFTKEIKPGNEYRQVDLRDINVYTGNYASAHRDGVETARRYLSDRKDLNGGSILTNYNNDYADYLQVTFKLRLSENIWKRLFIVGAFNDWKVQPEYEMLADNGLFIGNFPMKRGIYDYQYVTADVEYGNVKNIDWYAIEGNSWNTSNIYYIFLYYTDTKFNGYDRIIGYQKIVSE